MRSFEIPDFYKSPIISRVKHARKVLDPRKQDFSPSVLDFGAVKFVLARHFGFCYGVENAIEIAYKAIDENPGKRIFLLSQMIHSPEVNSDLKSRGVDFLMDTEGNVLTPITELKSDDPSLSSCINGWLGSQTNEEGSYFRINDWSNRLHQLTEICGVVALMN